MAWTLEYGPAARKQLCKLGKTEGNRILLGLEKVAALDDPRQRGKALTGDQAGYWRWRFGDYRVIARIEDHRVDPCHRDRPQARRL